MSGPVRGYWPAHPDAVIPPVPAVEEPPDLALRVAVLLVGLCGLGALSGAGLMSAPVGTAAAALVAAAASAPVVLPSGTGRLLRRIASSATLLTALVATTVVLAGSDVVAPPDIARILGRLLTGLLVAVVVAQLLVVERLRELRVVLVLSAAMLVLSVAVVASAATLGWLLLGWPVVLTALVLLHRAQSMARADVVSGRSAPDAAWLTSTVARLVCGSAVVAIVGVLLLPHPDGIRPRAFAHTGDSSESSTGTTARSSERFAGSQMDLRARGDLGDDPVMDVPADSPTLWRARVLATYDGVVWSPNPSSIEVVGRQDLPGDLDLAGFAAVPAGPTRVDEVRIRDRYPFVLLAPGQPTAVDLAGALVRTPGGYAIGMSPSSADLAGYRVTSRPLPEAGPAGTPVVDGSTPPLNALQLPETLPARVRDLGIRLTSSAVDRRGAVAAVENYLRSNEKYQLDSPVPPAGRDAVDHFLFEAHAGFCEQFASAEVVLLRAGGVPARLVTGFAGGERDGDHRVVREKDGHAWVDWWSPEVGWVTSDPTAGTELASPSLASRVRSLAQHRLTLALAVVLGTGVMLLGLSLWRRRDRRTPVRPEPPLLAAFRRLEGALAAAGEPRRPAESVRELAARLAVPSVDPGSVQTAPRALTVLERVSYAATRPSAADVDDAVRELDGISRRLSERAHSR